jgi:hypothetical protein
MEERVKIGFEHSTVKPTIVSPSSNGLTGEKTLAVLIVRQWRSTVKIFLDLTNRRSDSMTRTPPYSI